jgi:hypothetical protein
MASAAARWRRSPAGRCRAPARGARADGGDAEAIARAVLEADRLVQARLAERTAAPGAATLVSCVRGASAARWRVAWVGDCRATPARADRPGERARGLAATRAAQPLTRDDTYANLGERPPAGGSPDDPARMVGNGAVVGPNVVEATLAPGEALLLCSDGLHRHLSSAEMADAFARHASPAAACGALVEQARAEAAGTTRPCWCCGWAAAGRDRPDGTRGRRDGGRGPGRRGPRGSRRVARRGRGRRSGARCAGCCSRRRCSGWRPRSRGGSCRPAPRRKPPRRRPCRPTRRRPSAARRAASGDRPARGRAPAAAARADPPLTHARPHARSPSTARHERPGRPGMIDERLERVFGRDRLRMVTGSHVEVHREAAGPPGLRRRYTKRFLVTGDGDFRHWTEREWRILALLFGNGVQGIPRSCAST